MGRMRFCHDGCKETFEDCFEGYMFCPLCGIALDGSGIYREPGTSENPVRFARLAGTKEEKAVQLEKQHEVWEAGAKSGKVMCLTDMLGNMGF